MPGSPTTALRPVTHTQAHQRDQSGTAHMYIRQHRNRSRVALSPTHLGCTHPVPPHNRRNATAATATSDSSNTATQRREKQRVRLCTCGEEPGPHPDQSEQATDPCDPAKPCPFGTSPGACAARSKHVALGCLATARAWSSLLNPSRPAPVPAPAASSPSTWLHALASPDAEGG